MIIMPNKNNDFLILIIIFIHISPIHQVFVYFVEDIPSGPPMHFIMVSYKSKVLFFCVTVLLKKLEAHSSHRLIDCHTFRFAQLLP